MGRLFKMRRLFYRLFIGIFNGILLRFPFNSIRIFFLRLAGADVGPYTYIAAGVRTDFPWRLSIAENCYISTGVYLDCRGGAIKIGAGSDVSEGAVIYTLTHDIYSDQFLVKKGAVHIGERVWLCSRSIVLPGSDIGTGTVLGAGSVFKGSSGAFCLWQGNPAKFLKALPENRSKKIRALV